MLRFQNRFVFNFFNFLAPMPVGISCSATNSSIDVTWENPDTECLISGFNVAWKYNVLWNNNETTQGTETLKVNQYSIEEAIPYTEYSVRVITLVMGVAGDDYTNCSAVTPQKSKTPNYKRKV